MVWVRYLTGTPPPRASSCSSFFGALTSTTIFFSPFQPSRLALSQSISSWTQQTGTTAWPMRALYSARAGYCSGRPRAIAPLSAFSLAEALTLFSQMLTASSHSERPTTAAASLEPTPVLRHSSHSGLRWSNSTIRTCQLPFLPPRLLLFLDATFLALPEQE